MTGLSINPSTGVDWPGIGATFMRIHGERPENVGQTTATQATDRGRTGRSDQAGAPATADRVQVSDQARLLSAAIQAGFRMTPSMTNNTRIGTTAAAVDKPRLPPMGS